VIQYSPFTVLTDGGRAMRPPRVRFTVCRVMLVVAIVALLLTGGGMIARSRNFNRQAIAHAGEEERCRHVLEVRAGDIDEDLEEEKDCLKQAESTINESYRTLMMDLAARARERVEQDRQQLAALREQREHHQRLEEKYEWAAAHPWEWVGPDPPEPQYPQFGEPMPTGSFSMPPTRLQ
jgi:hypothetical protein